MTRTTRSKTPRGLPREANLAHALVKWFMSAKRDLPWRRTVDPYAVWISEIMLQQTQVRTVIPYWERWMRELPDVQSLAAADEARVLKLWEGLGYYRRARHLQAAARRIIEIHQGEFPRDKEAILELPGIGRYTAGAIASIAFNFPEPILDGNVTRVLTRVDAIAGDPRGPVVNPRLWALAKSLVEAARDTGHSRACSFLNQALMELGALVCTPRAPDCVHCPISSECRAARSGRQEQYPELPPRAPATPRYYIVIVASCGTRLGVRQRPASDLNGGLWEFPNLEVTSPTADPLVVASRLYGPSAAPLEPLAVVRHAITRYRVEQRAFLLELAQGSRGRSDVEWRTPAELESLAFSSAHGRILRAHARMVCKPK